MRFALTMRQLSHYAQLSCTFDSSHVYFSGFAGFLACFLTGFLAVYLAGWLARFNVASILLPLYLSPALSISRSIYLPLYLSPALSISRSIYLPLYLSPTISISRSICLPSCWRP